MYKVYSFIEAEGKSFLPPEVKGTKAQPPIYLASIGGRHYISVSGKIPKQPAEIDCQGPIDLTAKKNRELATQLRSSADPIRETRTARSQEYPSLNDQIGALMNEFAARASAGEKLTPELKKMIAAVAQTKKKYPKKDAEIGL